ncbi:MULTISPECIES: fatty acid desaturase [unclassified Pseudomonas]|uniref:fatty acid desaturase family protein n=1 Tax=unclassified Pseudomonas TaxID=196821 RepID=UPI000CD08BB7|nr:MULTISPECIES: fatty acid desaturase [unclassified Pseudomonas]POA15601.1 fatty acid desaturase [Pseudomonas sp. MPBD7-1]
METSVKPVANLDGRTFVDELRPLIEDLRRHHAWRYRLDFGLSIGLFWVALSMLEGAGSVTWPLWYGTAVFTLYRSAMFIHELSHMPRRAVPGFNLMWNLACGIPLLLPSFLYLSHIDHHTLGRYGTRQDPEYLPFEQQFGRSVITLLVGTLFTPLLLLVRFAVLGPASWCIAPLRRRVIERYSAVTLHAAYRNSATRFRSARGYNYLLEIATSLYAWGLIAAAGSEMLPWSRVGLFLAVIYGVLFINMFRTCLAHRYASSGEPVSLQWQLADSSTHDRQGSWLELLEPLSQRYHAMHHLFPALPYHSLRPAHERIMVAEGVAADLYRQTAGRLSPVSSPYSTENLS